MYSSSALISTRTKELRPFGVLDCLYASVIKLEALFLAQTRASPILMYSSPVLILAKTKELRSDGMLDCPYASGIKLLTLFLARTRTLRPDGVLDWPYASLNKLFLVHYLIWERELIQV